MNDSQLNTATEPQELRTGGYCRRCGKEHWLGPGNTLQHCRKLMHDLADRQTIDLFSPAQKNPAELATALLFGPARGKMFGVMECLQPNGTRMFMQAFSGQYNGLWQVDGWVPPLFAVRDFHALTITVEKQIKQLGREIDLYQAQSGDWLALRKKRRLLSRSLMGDIHALYTLNNFRGETAPLAEAFIGDKGIPAGTGDCCAPKLLNFAARHKLRPLGIVEFFWGRENRSGGRQQGVFSSSCAEKCQPILGFMLCGLGDMQTTKSTDGATRQI